MGGIDKTIFCLIDQELYNYNESQKTFRKLIIKLYHVKHQSHKTLDAQTPAQIINFTQKTKNTLIFASFKHGFPGTGMNLSSPTVALQLFATASNDDMHPGARWRPESLGFGGPVVGGTGKMATRNSGSTHQLRLVVYPTIYRVSYIQQVVNMANIPLFTGFQCFFLAPSRWGRWLVGNHRNYPAVCCDSWNEHFEAKDSWTKPQVWRDFLEPSLTSCSASAASRLANICKESPICHTKSSVVYWAPVFVATGELNVFYFPRCWLQIGLLWCLYTISYIEAACSFVLWILTAKRISQIVTPRTLLNGHVKPKLRTIHLRHVRMHGHPNIKW